MKYLLCALLMIAAWPASAQTYRCPDEHGRPFYSNLGCDRSQRPIDAGNAGISGRSNTSSLVGLMDSVSLETDSEKRRSLIQTIHTSVAAYKAQAYAEAQSQAEAKAGVPELEKQLRASEENDRASPSWPQYKSDSPISARIRASLLSARDHANRSAASLLAMNVDYARVMARYVNLEKAR